MVTVRYVIKSRLRKQQNVMVIYASAESRDQ